MLKKGDLVTGTVEKVEFPNKGVLCIEGESVIVKNVIPGQTVCCSIKKKRQKKWEGQLCQIEKDSPYEERTPACEVFGLCGGCTYQTVPYQTQKQWKEQQVFALLKNVSDGFVWDGIYQSPAEWEYRNKMEFSFGNQEKNGPLVLGLHRRGSFYDIVPARTCRLIDEDGRRILQETEQYFRANQVPFYHKKTREGYLRHLVIRKSKTTGEILLNLITSSQQMKQQAGLAGWVEKIKSLPLNGKVVGILHTQNDAMADVVQKDQMDILDGQDYFVEQLLGLEFRISPFSFFQTNTDGAAVLYQIVREYIEKWKDDVVFDLYSGTGTIAQVVSSVAQKVVAVELVEEAVCMARKNAAQNDIKNSTFLCGDVFAVLKELQQRPDRIILDPPREGIHPKALQKMIEYGVQTFLYISCNPLTLVRDLQVLQQAGYQIERACCVDLFPQTVHVETVVKLSLKKDTPKIEVTNGA